MVDVNSATQQPGHPNPIKIIEVLFSIENIPPSHFVMGGHFGVKGQSLCPANQSYIILDNPYCFSSHNVSLPI